MVFIKTAACPKCKFAIPANFIDNWKDAQEEGFYICPSCGNKFCSDELLKSRVIFLKRKEIFNNLEKSLSISLDKKKLQDGKNKEKALGKIAINNSLMGISLAIFSAIWVFSQKKPDLVILVQFLFAVPLFYVSSNSYMKIAYREEKNRLWDHFGWITGTTATAFILNIIGILCFLLGFPTLTVIYFIFFWLLLLVYTIINIKTNPEGLYRHIFKLLYFVIIQLIFGLGIVFIEFGSK